MRASEDAGRESVGARLRALGQRVTPARVAVVSVLARTSEHLGAAEIADRCTALDPGVHRATVYRALATLTELGVVSHTHTSGSGAVYHLTGSIAPAGHAHLECTACGGIVDVPAALLADLTVAVGATYGFTLEPDHATLLGVCRSCRGTTDAQPDHTTQEPGPVSERRQAGAPLSGRPSADVALPPT